jgi:hypothetical protein
MDEKRKSRARQVYSDEVKAAALADLVLLGPGATAAKYGIPVGTIHSWSSRNDPLASLKKEHIGAIAARYLEANLQALIAQAYVASDPDYINRQPAESLAVLHGVMADKSIRLFEALHATDAGAEQPALDSAG